MLVKLSWYVIVSDDQAGKPESFPSFTVMSISGAHHRQFRPGWTFAGGAGAKQPNFPLDSLPASSGLTCARVRALSIWLHWTPQSFYATALCPVGNNAKRTQRGRSS